MSLVLDNSVAMLLWLLSQSNPAGIGLARKVLAMLKRRSMRPIVVVV